MRIRYVSLVALVLSGCVALAGCNGSTTPAGFPNISGDYTGTMQDAQGGSGTVTGTLAQTGPSAGGAITDVETAQTITGNLSLTVTPSYSFSGTMVVDYPSNGPTCTFHTTGTYFSNSSGSGLRGTYKAVTNCSGDSGSYTLTQQCTDTITSSDRRRPTGFPAAC